MNSVLLLFPIKTFCFTGLFIGLLGQHLACYASNEGYSPTEDLNSHIPEHENSGIQNFGQYREILRAGGIPGPATINASELFDDHEIVLPVTSCPQILCLHGHLGVKSNFISGNNLTMVLVDISLNDHLTDRVDEKHLPLHLSIAIDTSDSMAGERLKHVQAGLHLMLAGLNDEDRVSITGYSDHAQILIDYQVPHAPVLATAISEIAIGGSSNLFDGLHQSYELAKAHETSTHQNRVLLISDGAANRGITNPAKIVEMSRSYNQLGLSLSTVGIGSEFDADMLRNLAESGAGTFYFGQNIRSVHEILIQEAQAPLLPLAKNIEINGTIHNGFGLSTIFGSRSAESVGNQFSIKIPLLQLATQVSNPSADSGRRGGGGTIVLELLPTGKKPSQVAELELIYEEPATGQLHIQTVSIESPLAPSETPSNGFFSDPSAAEAFAMVNAYLGLYDSMRYAQKGRNSLAIDTLTRLSQSSTRWLTNYPDPDTEEDLDFAQLFIENLLAQ